MNGRLAAAAICLISITLLCGPDSYAAAGTPIPDKIQGSVRMSGNMDLTGTVTVEKEGILIIEKGSHINAGKDSAIIVFGKLEITGTVKERVIIKGRENTQWKGISFYSGSKGEITGSDILDAKTALTILAADVSVGSSLIKGSKTGAYLANEAISEFNGVRFESNQVGIAAELKSRSQITGCTFVQNKVGIGVASGALPQIINNRFQENEFGIQVRQRFPGVIQGNVLVKNDVGIRLYQNGPDTVVEKNLFLENRQSAVVAESFSSPKIMNNRIKGGRFGIFASQFSSPVIRNNSLSRLEEAIHLNKKNVSVIRDNVLSRSDVGIFFDFSSYPVVKNNFFDRNSKHIKLGRFQSSHWEASAGSKKYIMANASRIGSRNPRLAESSDDFPETIDATGNLWDKKTLREIDQKGPDANISTLFDGYDLNEVTYEGFGDKKYRIDKVRYVPMLSDPEEKIGLLDWNGEEDELKAP